MPDLAVCRFGAVIDFRLRKGRRALDPRTQANGCFVQGAHRHLATVGCNQATGSASYAFRRHEGEKWGQTSFEQSIGLPSFEVGVAAAVADSSPAATGVAHWTVPVTKTKVIAIANGIFILSPWARSV